MFRPLECFIGLRYLGASRRRGIVSFVSGASFLGIALGVAALIVILSVMNGLEGEFRKRLLTLEEHVSVAAASGGLTDWEAVRARILELEGVTSVTPHASVEGMLSAGANLEPALIRGILPEQEAAASPLAEIVDRNALALLTPGSQRIVLGRYLALNLGVIEGDRVSAWRASMTGGLPEVEQRGFVVAAIFDAGVEQHDSSLALANLVDAGALLGLHGEPESLAIRLDDPMRAEQFTAELEAMFGPAFEYSNWVEQNRSLFRAMRIEKTMMTVILLFIAGVAAFNIVASLMMVVNEKERDIAILRTYGLEPARVVRVFFVQGAAIGLIGTLVGVALGLLLAANVETIVPWLESTFHFQIMPGDVFYITEIPSEIELSDVLLVPSLAFGMALIATIFPSRRAARVAPAQALRYE
jgi:lipoprotein-releasing system permease protein